MSAELLSMYELALTSDGCAALAVTACASMPHAGYGHLPLKMTSSTSTPNRFNARGLILGAVHRWFYLRTVRDRWAAGAI